MTTNWSANRLLDHVEIDHGPRELLARLFISTAENALRLGVALEFGEPQDLVTVNEANRDSWLPLTTSFHPAYGGVTNDNMVVFLGRNQADEIVLTYAIKFLDWCETDFKTEAESLRFFYALPERDKAPDEACFVTADRAALLSGRLQQVGALWIRPDYRKVGLSEIIPRVGRAYGCAHWNIDASFAIICADNRSAGVDARVGYRPEQVFAGVTMRNSPTMPNQDFELALCVYQRDQLIDDLYGYLREHDWNNAGLVDRRSA